MKSLTQAAIAAAVVTLASAAGAQEARDVVGYLNLLDSSAIARDAHTASPVAAMTAYGLTLEQQSAFLTADNSVLAQSAGIPYEKLIKIQVDNIDATYLP